MGDRHERADVASLLAAAHEALDELIEADLTGCTEDELLEAFRAFERLRRRMPTVDHALVLEAEARSLPDRFACRNTAQFLRGLLRLDPREAWARVHAAEVGGSRRSLSGDPLPPAYPVVAQAQAAGAISERHARIVADTIEKLPDAPRTELGPELEADLVAHATRFDPHQLSKIAMRVRDCYDPDGAEPDVAHRERNRYLHVHARTDGSSRVEGELTAECTERLLVLFDSLAAPKPEVDGIKDARTAGQRNHDALLDGLAMLQACGDLPTASGVPATVVVTMTQESYETGKGLAQTSHGALVPAGETLRWAGGDLRLMAVVIDRIKGITAYSTAQRLFTEQQRLAIFARDGGCTFPNCPAPPWHCQVHHLTDYAITGHTRVDDGGLACGHDHRERIRQGWTTRLVDGRVGWIPPRWIDPQQRPQFNELHRPRDVA